MFLHTPMLASFITLVTTAAPSLLPAIHISAEPATFDNYLVHFLAF